MEKDRDPTPPRKEPSCASNFFRIILPLVSVVGVVGLALQSSGSHNSVSIPDPVSTDLPPPSFTPLLIIPANSTELPLLRERIKSNPLDYESGCRYWFSIQQTDVNQSHSQNVLSYYHRIARANISLGNLLLGNAYQVGYGTVINIQKSIENYRIAMEKGDLNGQFLYALALARSENVEEKSIEALKYLKKAAHCGHSLSMVWLAEILAQSQNSTENLEKAVNWLEKAVQKGCVEAEILLAQKWILGRGTERSVSGAARLLNEVATSKDFRDREDIQKLFWETVNLFCEEGKQLIPNRRSNYFRYAKELGHKCEQE